MSTQGTLWDDDDDGPHRPGAVRRALDASIRAAKADGLDLLDVEVATLRRQANDIDRLERLVSVRTVKAWDYTPKTAAQVAFSEAVSKVFGRDRAGDAFTAALDDFMRTEAGHPTGPQPPH